MSILERPISKRQRTRRVDPAHKALDIALCLWSNGHLATLSWCAAGRPARGIEPVDVEYFQAARRIVHANRGTILPGDAERLLAVMERRRARR
jgi:hypothetical protein